MNKQRCERKRDNMERKKPHRKIFIFDYFRLSIDYLTIY